VPEIAENSNNRTSRYVLIVDNNISDLFLAAMLLQHFNYQVCTASTVGQTLDLVSVAMPSLIMTDLVLPGMSGVDLLRLVKQDPRTASIPVVIFYHAGDEAAERRCRDAGAAGCIPKPIEAEHLFRTVQRTIEHTPRANIRIQTTLSVTINRQSLDMIEGDCASILSEQGMYVRMSDPYPRNELLTVQINLNGQKISVDTMVLYSYTHGYGPFKEPGMGLRFLRIAPEDQLFIRKFIREEIMKGIAARKA
jgi:CheY-like chemotaxis protein